MSNKLKQPFNFWTEDNRLQDVGSSVTPITSYSYEDLQGYAMYGINRTFSDCLQIYKPSVKTANLKTAVIDSNIAINNSTEPNFYYLTDHLGSSSYMVNDAGQITQTLAYLPYGESWVDLNNNTPYPPLTPHKFNGKEKDEETGFNYFGARYYWDFLPQFISPDPMSDKYPHLSPMAYCSNNPIMKIDPDGREDDWVENANQEIYWNDKATSQASTPRGEKYLGKEGYALNEVSGAAQHYKRDGTIDEAPAGLEDITISANRPQQNILKSYGLDIISMALPILSEVSGKKLGGAFTYGGYALDGYNAFNAYNNNSPGFKRNYEVGKALAPSVFSAFLGGFCGALAIPAIITFDKALEGMQKVKSEIDSWGNKLPSAIINNHR